MSGENIFSALAKYNSATAENYLTEAFVFLINSLLERDRSVGLEILTRLCVENNEFSFGTDEAIAVSTQEVTEQGTPDIKVSSPNKLIYIEVKHDSELGYQQIERYNKALESSNTTIQHVILLTRYSVDLEEQDERPYKHVRWFEVYNWLTETRTRAKDPVSVYLTDAFKSFLEVKGMSIEKVGWEYINGMSALNNLMNMIEVAIQHTKHKVHRKSGTWNEKGFYVESIQFWYGIFYDEPIDVIFWIGNPKEFNAKLLDKPTYPLDAERNGLCFHLRLEDAHFFSLDKEAQLEEITKFVKTAYAEAQKMRIP